jgi:hypothetical protein
MMDNYGTLVATKRHNSHIKAKLDYDSIMDCLNVAITEQEEATTGGRGGGLVHDAILKQPCDFKNGKGFGMYLQTLVVTFSR